jgi:PAS domain S-box-containing protein
MRDAYYVLRVACDDHITKHVSRMAKEEKEIMNQPLRVLILEDAPTDAELIERELRAALPGHLICSAKRVETRDDFLTAMEEFAPDLILSDYTLPAFDGLSALSLARDVCPDVPFIFVSGTLGEEVAIETLKRGATDYVLKDRLSRLGPSVQRALREAEEHRERRRAEDMLSRLQQETSQLVGQMDVDWLYQAVLRAAGAIVPSDLVALEQTNGDGLKSWGTGEPGRGGERARERGGESGFPALSRSPALPLSRSPSLLLSVGLIEAAAAEISVPLVKGDRSLGTLTLHRLEGHFTEAERRILNIFANYAAGLIEAAQLYKQIQQAEARYRDLYDQAPDGYSAIAADGVVTEMNATMLSWLGYDRQDILGRGHFEDFLTPEGQRKLALVLQRCRRDGCVRNVELELGRRDGQFVPVRLNMTMIRDADGGDLGFCVTARDITKEKELEAQLLQAQKLESLGTLVGGIAHDFNNMLSGILGFSQLMMEEIAPTSPVYEGLQRIEVLSERAAEMIKQMLAFSRRGMVQKTNLWLHPFLKEVAKLLERIIPENIEVELGLAADRLTVEADPTQLQQMVMNLAVNARDAMPDGGRLRLETARVELGEEFCRAHPDARPGSYVRLGVSDSGTGIAPEIRSRIFDPFFTTKEAGKGTGLGLSVVYGIVKNHGGAIEMESELGRGTAFHVYLPLAAAPAVAEEPPPLETRRGKETILLVDDEAIVLEVGKMALERMGYRVLIAHDGLEAIQVYREHQANVSLVLMDVVMPKLGGREAFLELKRLNPQIKVLMATGYNSSNAPLNELLTDGVCGLIVKPYHIRKLAQTVRAALEQ